MDQTPVSAAEFAALDGLDEWRFMLGAITAEYRARSYPAAASLIETVAEAAEDARHHPDVDLRYPGLVRFVLTTHAAGSLTVLDIDLARTISALAAGAGAEPTRAGLQALEVAIDTMDADRIRPFWAAVLGYRDEGGNLVDPRRIGPPFWFQQMEAPRTERGRFHIDISLPHDVAEERMAAAIAAGGRLVTDRYARSWWVLADADGNEACISTWQDR